MAARKFTEFQWNGRREEAASLLAQDVLTDEQIAEKVGISRRQLANWKLVPEFAAKVASIVEETRQALQRRGIAERQNRVNALNDRWDRMQRIIAARAEEYRNVPGGETGLFVREVQLVKVYNGGDDPGDEDDVLYSAKKFVEIERFSIDTGLLKEMRAHEEQAAKELGQWAEKIQQTGNTTIRVVYDDPED